MMSQTFDPTAPLAEPLAPSAADTQLALESARRLAPQLAKANGTMQLQVVDAAGGGETVIIPTSAMRLLVSVLTEMARGNAVSLIPLHAELTTREAAELLNVSRPYLVRLLDEGAIPSHRVGTHRRVRFKEVMAYKAEHYRLRSAALDDLARQSQELGLY